MRRLALPLLLLLAACAHAPAAAVRTEVKALAPVNRAQAQLVDFSWVGATQGWALGRAVCGSGFCLQLYATVDGGAHWQLLPALPRASISHVRFATPAIGYLWGPDLLITEDGGRTWVRGLSRPVEDLESAGTAVYRLVSDATRTLYVANAGETSWVSLLTVARGGVGHVVSAGDELFVPVLGGAGHTAIWRSGDGGADWRKLADPCHGGGASAFSASPALAVALCGESMVTSADAGSSWGSPIGLASGIDAVAAVAGRIVVASATRLYESADGGAHLTGSLVSSAVPGSDDFPTLLDFTDANAGHWAGSATGGIWSTADGGHAWHWSAFP